MDTDLLIEKFERMGARLKLGVLRPAWRPAGERNDGDADRIAVDIRRDDKGEYFDLRLPPGSKTQVDVIDVRPSDRHLLLMAKPLPARPGVAVTWDRKQKFLCGYDERSWFVAAVPETAGASNVRTALAALKPSAVQAAEARQRVPSGQRNRRKNRAFVRQGEWFFVPARTSLVVDERLVIRNEMLLRSSGGKPHVAEFCFRSGGQTVYFGPPEHGVLTPEEYEKLVRHKPHLKKAFRQFRQNAGVYVKGKVRHPDHKTITMHDWHEVQMNTETQAKAMRHVVFLD
jgi:hypothetical protein